MDIFINCLLSEAPSGEKLNTIGSFDAYACPSQKSHPRKCVDINVFASSVAGAPGRS